MIGLERHHLAGVRIRRRDHAAIPLEDEGAGRLADRELRQKIRDTRQLDNDRQHAGGPVIDLNGSSERRGQPFAARMRGKRRPVLVIGPNRFAKPFLIGDRIFGVLEPAAREREIVANVFVPVDPHLAVRRDLEHFDDGIAELVPGKERSVRPGECDPGNGRLRQQLRLEHHFALPGVARLEHFFRQQRAHRQHRRSRFGGDRLQFIADGGHDLVVDGIGQGLADLLRRAPPQQMHADGADDDGGQYEGRNGAADADAHARSWLAGLLPQYGTILTFVSPPAPSRGSGHGSVTGVEP